MLQICTAKQYHENVGFLFMFSVIAAHINAIARLWTCYFPLFYCLPEGCLKCLIFHLLIANICRRAEEITCSKNAIINILLEHVKRTNLNGPTHYIVYTMKFRTQHQRLAQRYQHQHFVFKFTQNWKGKN